MDTSNPPGEPSDNNGVPSDKNSQEDTMSQDSNSGDHPKEEKKKEPKKPKKSIVDLPIVKLAGYRIPLEAFIEFEVGSRWIKFNLTSETHARNWYGWEA